MQRAVSEGKINFLSVSQITIFDPSQYGGCERKWYFDKVLRVERPEERQHVDGRAFHRELEHYLRTGEDVLGNVTRAGKHLLPLPGPDLLLEQDLGKTVTVLGIPLVGSIDCVQKRGSYVDSLGTLRDDPADTIEVIDFKSTADLKYAKTGAELLKTVQMVGYAIWVSLTFPDTKNFRLSHIYFQKRGKKQALKATALFSLDQIKDRWHGIERTVKRMTQVAKAPCVEEVTPNFESCSAYRGCPFRAICPKPKEVVLAQVFGGSTVGLLDKLKAFQAPAPVVSPASVVETGTPLPEITKPLDVLHATSAEVQAEIEALKAQEQKINALSAFGDSVACDSCGVSLDANNSSTLKSGRLVHVRCPAQNPVLPPDAPESKAPHSAEPIPAGTALHPVIAEAAKAFQPQDMPLFESKPNGEVELASYAPADQLQELPVVQTEEAPKTRKGRRKKSEEKAPEYESPVYSLAVSGLVLLVDAVAEGQADLQSLDPYLQKLCDALCAEFKAPDIRCAPADSPLGFGKWKGALAALIRSEPPAPGVYVVRDVKESEIKQVAVETLKPLASLFVRGV